MMENHHLLKGIQYVPRKIYLDILIFQKTKFRIVL